VPLKALKWLFKSDAPFKFHLDRDQPLRQIRWLAAMFAQCTVSDFERNKSDMLALSHFSHEALTALRTTLPELSFDHQQKGTLQLFRTAKQLEAGHLDELMLSNAGVRTELITDRSRLHTLEPALANSSAPLVGGLHLPADETGDCNMFTLQLAMAAAAAGVEFHFNEEVVGWHHTGLSHRMLQTNRRLYDYDALVFCAGTYAADLLLPLNVDLRHTLYPVKGYSLTFELEAAEKGPVSTVMDETYKVAITRLGSRVRVGGTAEFSGFNHILRDQRRKTLSRSVSDLFPGAGRVGDAKFWTGLRPSTPTGVPIIGKLPAQRIWANFGHGTLGWTMAAGSARILAMEMSGQQQELPEAVRRAVSNGLNLS
jgi:D-amino-acid dehydrogenase